MPDEAPARPFAIGITPLGDRPWLVVDDRLQPYLAEKQRLMAMHPDKVYMAETETATAQVEVLARVADWQVTRYPDAFEQTNKGVLARNAPALPEDAPTLVRAAMLCAEDLVIMRKGDDGWRIAAASLSFPSSWRLAEKFSRPMEAIHEPVPGYGGGTRNAALINRIFDNLAPDQPVIRGNWSVYGDDRLHYPDAHAGERSADLPAGTLFLREERQTLTRLPGTGDILFTILITVGPLMDLAASAAGRSRAAALSAGLKAMKPEELAYKSLDGQAQAISRLLDAMATPRS